MVVQHAAKRWQAQRSRGAREPPERAGFVVMVLSALLIYRYLGQLGRDQIRAMQEGGRLSLTGLLGRLAGRFRPPPPPPST